MNKTIKQIKTGSILMLLSSLLLAIVSQYIIVSLSIDKEPKTKDFAKMESFIKTTEDIDKLKNVSLLLLESKIAYTDHMNKLFYNIRNFSLAFSVFPAMLVFYVFRLNKQFLTSSSSGTDNP